MGKGAQRRPPFCAAQTTLPLYRIHPLPASLPHPLQPLLPLFHPSFLFFPFALFVGYNELHHQRKKKKQGGGGERGKKGRKKKSTDGLFGSSCRPASSHAVSLRHRGPKAIPKGCSSWKHFLSSSHFSHASFPLLGTKSPPAACTALLGPPRISALDLRIRYPKMCQEAEQGNITPNVVGPPRDHPHPHPSVPSPHGGMQPQGDAERMGAGMGNPTQWGKTTRKDAQNQQDRPRPPPSPPRSSVALPHGGEQPMLRDPQPSPRTATLGFTRGWRSQAGQPLWSLIRGCRMPGMP